jgi:hypothetical protein
MAAHHFADMEMQRARDGFQVFVRPIDQFVGRIRIVRIGPENNNV